MAYVVDCDACEFDREYDDEVTAYSVAKEHEAAFPDHFVYMERLV